MKARTCDDPTSSLLPRYVSGSLEGEERARFEAHLRTCAACGAEVEELSRPSRRRWLVAASVAAPLVVLAGTALYLYLRGPSVHLVRGGLQEGAEILELDLGLGPDRGGRTILMLTAPAGLREVILDFVVPVIPGALCEVEIRGPAEEPLIRYECAPILLDDLGGSQVPVPASRLANAGDYQLVLRQCAPGGGVREYRYPFRVKLPSSQ